MPQGDKYIHFTNYLKKCHEQGQDELTLSFTEIERIWGFPLARSMRKYSWANDRTQSYALGWLYADFTVTACDLSAELVAFAYTPEKVSVLLSGQHSRGRGTSVSAAKLPSSVIAAPSASEELKKLTGNDKPIQDYVMGFDAAHIFLDKIMDLFDFLLPEYVQEGKNSLVIAIGCTGGKHRSVTLANAIADRLKKTEYGCKVEHRDIDKDAKRKL